MSLAKASNIMTRATTILAVVQTRTVMKRMTKRVIESDEESDREGRFVHSRAMASILVSPPPCVLPATQLCWDLGLFDQVDDWT